MAVQDPLLPLGPRPHSLDKQTYPVSLAREGARPPGSPLAPGSLISLARLCFSPGSSTVEYPAGHDGEPAQTLDALDFVVRVLAHVPEPRRHIVHCYGA